MKLFSTMLVTGDMAAARKFYEEVLGQKVAMDLGANLSFQSGFALQTRESWAQFIGKTETDIRAGQDDFELYFEEAEFDAFIARLEGFPVRYAHPACEQPWGQRAVRFYDPDGHLIEVGESMPAAIRRMGKQGMGPEEICRKTGYPMEFIRQSLAGMES